MFGVYRATEGLAPEEGSFIHVGRLAVDQQGAEAGIVHIGVLGFLLFTQTETARTKFSKRPSQVRGPCAKSSTTNQILWSGRSHRQHVTRAPYQEGSNTVWRQV